MTDISVPDPDALASIAELLAGSPLPDTVTPPPLVAVSVPDVTPKVAVSVPEPASTSDSEIPVRPTDVSSLVL